MVDPSVEPSAVLIRLREVWKALGCAWNPDDFKPAVQERMWGQALEVIREYTAGATRVDRENQELLAEVQRLRASRAGALDEEKLATALRATGRWKVLRRPTRRERIRGLLRRERSITVDITLDTTPFDGLDLIETPLTGSVFVLKRHAHEHTNAGDA